MPIAYNNQAIHNSLRSYSQHNRGVRNLISRVLIVVFIVLALEYPISLIFFGDYRGQEFNNPLQITNHQDIEKLKRFTSKSASTADRLRTVLSLVESLQNSLEYQAHCKNSIGGRRILCDNLGYICHRRNIDIETGCCQKVAGNPNVHGDLVVNISHGDHQDYQPRRFDCTDCISGCCLELENCISCCMKPSNLNVFGNLYLSLPALASDNEKKSGFDYCLYVCRTSSASVQSENSYRGYHNHCYGDLKAPVEKYSVNSDWAGIVKSKQT